MQALKGLGGGVTTSFLPGTTLGITELDLGNGLSLFDTPGLIVPSQLTNRLEMAERILEEQLRERKENLKVRANNPSLACGKSPAGIWKLRPSSSASRGA